MRLVGTTRSYAVPPATARAAPPPDPSALSTRQPRNGGLCLSIEVSEENAHGVKINFADADFLERRKNGGRENEGRKTREKKEVLTTDYCRRQTPRTAQNARPDEKKYPGREKGNIGLPVYGKCTLRRSDLRSQEKAKYLIRLRGLGKLYRATRRYWKQVWAGTSQVSRAASTLMTGADFWESCKCVVLRKLDPGKLNR